MLDDGDDRNEVMMKLLMETIKIMEMAVTMDILEMIDKIVTWRPAA